MTPEEARIELQTWCDANDVELMFEDKGIRELYDEKDKSYLSRLAFAECRPKPDGRFSELHENPAYRQFVIYGEFDFMLSQIIESFETALQDTNSHSPGTSSHTDPASI